MGATLKGKVIAVLDVVDGFLPFVDIKYIHQKSHYFFQLTLARMEKANETIAHNEESPRRIMQTNQKKNDKRRPLTTAQDNPITGVVVGKKRTQCQKKGGADETLSPRPLKKKAHRDGCPVVVVSPESPNNNNNNKRHWQVMKPPDRSNYTSDLVVVLDLDECLIHAEIIDEPCPASSSSSSSYAYQKVPNHNNKSLPRGAATTGVEAFWVQLDQNCSALVHMRPGLLDFLQEITSQYETHIYTASTSDYADVILDHLCSMVLGYTQNSDMFAGRWYRQHCAYHNSQGGVYVKDLSHLPVPLDRTVLVDNNPVSFLAQPENGILVNSFYDDETDRTLASVSRFIAQQLQSKLVDVRTVLADGPVPVETFS